MLESYLNTIHHIGQTDSSVANFYSPIESAHNSDSECDEDDLYKNKAIADVQAACELLECIDWKMEKIISLTGDRIQSIQRKKFGKIYRLTVKYFCFNFFFSSNRIKIFFLQFLGSNEFAGKRFIT